jgi:hypothetical protein
MSFRTRAGWGGKWQSAAVEVAPVLDALTGHGCRFVVVGSAARRLVGETVQVQDLDVLVDAAPEGRDAVVEALADVGATVRRRRGRLPVHPGMGLPWEWGWQARTAWGDIDLITRFIDGSTVDEHDARAVSVELPSGSVVRCHPTRHR